MMMFRLTQKLTHFFPNIDLINYYTKTEIDDLGNELPTLVLNTYNKTEIYTFFNILL